jgi:hypothetical protein
MLFWPMDRHPAGKSVLFSVTWLAREDAKALSLIYSTMTKLLLKDCNTQKKLLMIISIGDLLLEPTI